MEDMETSLEAVLRTFLSEDVGYGDITTTSLVIQGKKATGYVLCKESCIVAGMNEARILLEKIVGCKVTRIVNDGARVKPATVLIHATGPVEGLLKVERTLLNLVSHMSGVATATDQLVQLAHKQGRQVRIAATRKTLPGLRYFEKRAVELGGGDTHRLRLDDMILIKDNHLEVVGSVDTAVKTAKLHASFTKKIEIEVTKPSDAVKAAQAGADIILLDNMPPEIVQETVGLLRKKKLRDKVLLEVSGGINIENIGEYLRTGIDIVSVGRITSSAHSIDMSFELEPRKTS